MDSRPKLGVQGIFRKCHECLLNASVLECNNFGHNLSFYGEIAAITYIKTKQNYRKYIFNEIISRNLQPIRNDENNIKNYWIVFTLLFLYKQLHNRRSKVIFVIISLIQYTVMFYTLNAVCQIKASLHTNLQISNKGIFAIGFLRITYKINVFSVDMHFKLFTICKMKNKYHPLY